MSGAATIVLKIGGSFLLNKETNEPEVSSLREMAEVVRDLLAANVARRVAVIVGGGISARNYIGAAGALGASKGLQDHLGVLVSRLNARVFVEALRECDVDAWPEPPESLQVCETCHILQTNVLCATHCLKMVSLRLCALLWPLLVSSCLAACSQVRVRQQLQRWLLSIVVHHV